MKEPMKIQCLLLVAACVLLLDRSEPVFAAEVTAKFASPTATFETAKQAMVRGDYETFCHCFSEDGLSLMAGSLRMMTGMIEWAGKQENADKRGVKMAKGLGRINRRHVKSQPTTEVEIDLNASPEDFMASVRKMAEPIDDHSGYVSAVLKLLRANDNRPKKNQPMADAVLQDLKVGGASATAIMHGTFLKPRKSEEPIVFRRKGLAWKIEQLGQFGITETVTHASPVQQTPPPKNRHPANTEVRDAQGYTPLMRAAKMGQTGIVKRLLDGGAEIDAKPDVGEWTALCLAIHAKHRDTVQLLVDRGAKFPEHESFAHSMRRSANRLGVRLPGNPITQSNTVRGKNPTKPKKFVPPVLPDVATLKPIDRPDEKGFSQLHWAVVARGVESTQTLLDQGADVDVRQRKFQGTPLQYAASSGRLDTVQLLIKHKATVDAVDLSLRTPLMWAAWNGHADVAQALLDAGADLHKTSRGIRWTALHFAADRGKFETAQLLIERGASLTAKNTQGKTPLDLNLNIAPPK